MTDEQIMGHSKEYVERTIKKQFGYKGSFDDLTKEKVELGIRFTGQSIINYRLGSLLKW